ncbi:leucine-rich repeat flightless-interacting protein 1 isoform X12 [Syngnathus acus]|uniref:leucine-rich repeat flightless-interacting protein 1 isoform X12 n=1 Tax=Syngnathus acus TaxID=161584 RepID=UPI0018864C67|nr:leucine-rich repeat flightless-interacting protein 1 isoform X12 [Syngnathus acus]
MGTQGTGRKRNSNKERTTAEDDALNLIARDAEARLAAKRAARAEAREIRMRELERQQKEIFQVQKKYYGLNPKADDRSDSKWGDIEQWMEDSERYSRPSHTHTLSDDDERMSAGSRGSARSELDAVYGAGGSSLLSHKSKKKKKHKHKDKDRNGHDDEHSVLSSRASYAASSDMYSLNGLSAAAAGRNPASTGSYQSSLYEDGLYSGSRQVSGSNSGSHIPIEYASYRSSSNSRTSSRANSARTSPVDERGGSVASLLRSVSGSRGLPRDLANVTIPDFLDVDDRDYPEKGSRAASALTATTLTSLGGSSSRRGSVESALTVDAESATREIKEALAEVEEKYRKAMVSNAQLDNEKNNLMYQVDTLKDSLMELEELLSESRRQFEDKLKDFEREQHAHSVLQFQFNDMKETLKQSEELLNKHGIVLGPDLSVNGDANETETDAAAGGDGASPSSPAEGSSVLGSSDDSGLRSRGKEAVDQEERGQVFEEGQTSAADRLSDTYEASGSVKEKMANAVVQDNDATGQTVTRVNSDLEETDAIMNGNLIEAVQELCPQDQTSPQTSCPVGANESESSRQEQMKDSESCPHLELLHEEMGDVVAFEENSQSCPLDGEYAEPCPRVQGVGEPQSGLQADLQSSPQEDIPPSKSCQGEDVKTSPHGDGKDFESNIQDPEWCPQVEVKSSEWCPQVEDAKDDGQEDGNDSEPCSRVQVGQDSQSGPRVVEGIAELQQETAEASSGDAETNVTKPAAGKSANVRGKKKKKKRRGKRKAEELSHQRDNKGGNGTTEQDKLQTEGAGAPLANADCAHDIQCLQEATQQAEPANLHHLQESTTAQMLHADEQSSRHLEMEKVEIVQAQAPKESFDSAEAQEGSDPILDKDAIIDDTTIVSGPGDTTFVQNEVETSSPTLNDNKEDSVGQLESCDEAASESHNRVSVTSPDDIGDGLQDSSSSSALRADSLTEVVFKQQTFTNQEDEEILKKDNDHLLTFVQPEKSSHDLDEEETRAGLVADGRTLLCEDGFVDAALDTLESQKVSHQVTNENLAAAEEHESMEGDHQAADLRACQQDSGEDEDEKGHSFDFDDMDLDTAVETLGNPERRRVEVGDEDVASDELQTDKNRKDSEAVAPEQTDVEMAVEVLPDECSKNNNNSNTETPTTRRDARGAAPNVLTNVESHGKDGQPSNTGLPQTPGEDQIPAQAAPLAVDSVENAQDASATLSNMEAPVSGKDSKKNGKQGKGKGKDDCKVT